MAEEEATDGSQNTPVFPQIQKYIHIWEALNYDNFPNSVYMYMSYLFLYSAVFVLVRVLHTRVLNN